MKWISLRGFLISLFTVAWVVSGAAWLASLVVQEGRNTLILGRYGYVATRDIGWNVALCLGQFRDTWVAIVPSRGVITLRYTCPTQLVPGGRHSYIALGRFEVVRRIRPPTTFFYYKGAPGSEEQRRHLLPTDNYLVTMPCWVLFTLLGVYPTSAFLRGPVREKWRRRQGRCVGCGYSLEGNVSGICPECGGRSPQHAEKGVNSSQAKSPED
jgi:hypothetical protein